MKKFKWKHDELRPGPRAVAHALAIGTNQGAVGRLGDVGEGFVDIVVAGDSDGLHVLNLLDLSRKLFNILKFTKSTFN